VESFEEVGLSPELTEILAAEGMDRPTPFQEQALPLVRRGNNVVGHAGPGAGTLVAWGAGLLDRLIAEEEDAEDPVPHGPRAVVLTPTADAAEATAPSLALLAHPLGLKVASLSDAWVLPERADVLFGTPSAILEKVRESRLSLASVGTVVVDQLTSLASLEGLEALEALFESVDGDAQRVVLDVPSRDARAQDARQAASSFVERHVRRAVTVPPRAVDEAEGGPSRGTVHYRIVEDPGDEAGLAMISELLGEGELRHLTVFFRNDDRAADIGDLLALHGFGVGAPGDSAVPVWLGVEELEAREAMDALEPPDAVGVLSWDVPFGPDSLDRRHGGGRGGHVMVAPREVPHLRDVARRTGYGIKPAPPPARRRIPHALAGTVESVAHALENEDIGAYLLVLETLFEDHDPAEVAAAALALLRKRGPAGETESRAEASRSDETPHVARGPAWAKLFLSLGRRDRAGPGDLVGAIVGEANVDGSKIGRIEIRESFSIVEVQEDVAERVIRALNGTTIKGRSVRADYDRGGQRRGGGRGRPGPGGRGPRER
jgi:ATP-dependent RNA helicase DeaD